MLHQFPFICSSCSSCFHIVSCWHNCSSCFIIPIILDHAQPLLIINHVTLPDQKRYKRAPVLIFVKVLQLRGGRGGGGGLRPPQPFAVSLQNSFTKASVTMSPFLHHDFTYMSYLFLRHVHYCVTCFVLFVMFFIMCHDCSSYFIIFHCFS